MLDFNQDDLDAPGIRLGVDDDLNPVIDLLPLSQKLVELCLTADAAQRYLGELRGCK